MQHYVFVGYVVFLVLVTLIGYIYFGYSHAGKHREEYGGAGVAFVVIAFLTMIVMGLALFGDGDDTQTIIHEYPDGVVVPTEEVE